MTDDEWEGIAFVLEEAFAGEFTDDAQRAYRMFLDEFDPTLVIAALHRLSDRDEPWLPKVPTIKAAVRKLMEEESGEGPIPGWSEAYAWLMRANAHAGNRRGAYFATEQESTVAACAFLEERCHPVVARFYEAEGYRRMTTTGFEDPDYGGIRQKELKDRWEEFVAVAKDRLASGLALQAVGRRPALAGPQKLSAVALLDSVRPEPRPQLPAASDPARTIGS